jgi:LPXTG-motif cell wall-anchored protein
VKDLPQHLQPSSDARLLTWIGAMVVMGAGAAWIGRRRRRAG